MNTHRRLLVSLPLVFGACSDPAGPRDPGLMAESGETFDTSSGSEDEGSEDPGPMDLPMGDGDLGDGDGDGDTSGDGDGDPSAPPLYPDDRVHAPLTPFVAENLGSIRGLAPAAPADVFMKIGASSTVSPSTLYCFADDVVDLGVHDAALSAGLDFYLLGEAGDSSPFDRDTLAAQSGKSAGWAIEGAPSPLAQEQAAIHPAGPSLALVHYGTNDMQLGITYASAMPGFFANMSDLLDALIDAGVVPIVFGISRRLDNPDADLWVESYNALIRGLAQARALPFVDLHLALEPLPGSGISGDDIHLEGFEGGPCIFSAEGLTHGYNVRNLIALEALDRARRVLVEGQDYQEPAPTLTGLGDLDDPLRVPALPFAHSSTTEDAPSLMLDVYSGCASMTDESGPENIYRLELEASTPIRAMVFDRAGVDVDVHLLDDSGTEAGCIARDDRMLQLTLDAGTYYFALDTYVNGEGEEQAGAYTFVVTACEAEDPECAL